MNKKIALVLLGTIILTFSGFNNKYPFLSTKICDYLHSDFERQTPDKGTIFYGLFVTHSSWSFSLWLTIITQSFILSLIILYYFKYFSPSKAIIPYYLTCLFFSSIFLSASVSASSISPGVFGSIAFLGIGILLFSKTLKRFDLYVISSIVTLGLIMDYAYILAALLILLFYLPFMLIRIFPQNKFFILPKWDRFIKCTLIIVVNVLLTTSASFLMGGGRANPFVPKLCDSRDTQKDLGKEVISRAFQNLLNINIYIDANYLRRDSVKTFNSLFDKYNNEVREIILARQVSFYMNYKYHNILYKALIVILLLFLILNYAFKIYNLYYYSISILLLLMNISYALSSSILFESATNSQYHVSWIITVPFFVYLSNSTYLSVFEKIKSKKVLLKVKIRNKYHNRSHILFEHEKYN